MSVESIQNGTIFCLKWHVMNNGLDHEGEPPRIKLCWLPPPLGLPALCKFVSDRVKMGKHVHSYKCATQGVKTKSFNAGAHVLGIT